MSLYILYVNFTHMSILHELPQDASSEYSQLCQYSHAAIPSGKLPETSLCLTQCLFHMCLLIQLRVLFLQTLLEKHVPTHY